MLKSSELVSPLSFPATSRAGLPLLVKSEWAITALVADGEHRWMPAGETADVLKYAQRNGVNYIFVSSQDVASPLNNLLLGDATGIPESLKLLHEESDGARLGRLFAFKSF